MLALIVVFGSLFVLFRRTQAWLHQHIFKVGWLLTGDIRVTTLVYYIVFLPGIVLHEATLWLAAGILNVRAESAIRFPEPQASGELRLNFVRLSSRAGERRLGLIRLAPVITGAVALWGIAMQVFGWRQLISQATSGSAASLLQAASALTGAADFWLWLYLAFAIANTMFPSQPTRLSRGRKVLLLGLAPLMLLAWQIGGALNAVFAAYLEGLLENLAILSLGVNALNGAAILGLGLFESAIERVTGKSATFRDGKMLVMTREEARARQRRQRSNDGTQAQPKGAGSAPPTPKSVYDFKLPIPGPPGREPISRQAVAVIEADAPQAAPDAHPTPAEVVKRPAAAATQAPADGATPPIIDADLPFSRPFAGAAEDAEDGQQWRDEADDADAPFSRPFSQ